MTKLEELSTALEQAQGEVADLGAQKAALLAQLAQVESRLAQAHARKVSLARTLNSRTQGTGWPVLRRACAYECSLSGVAVQHRQVLCWPGWLKQRLERMLIRCTQGCFSRTC